MLSHGIILFLLKTHFLALVPYVIEMSKLIFIENLIKYVQVLCELSKLPLYVNKCIILNKLSQQFYSDW